MILFTDQRDDAEASGEKVKRRRRNEVCAACTDLTEIFDRYYQRVSFNPLCLRSCQKFNCFFNCRKLVEQTMMEHENTKEARRKLQEYKQKLGKEFFAEFLHQSTRFSYDILLDFLIILHGRTDVLVPCLHQFWTLQVATYSSFTPISSWSSLAWFCCFNCYIFSLALLNFLSFFLVVQEVSKESQELMRKALEEVTLTFLPNFTFPFCGLKDAVDVARLFQKKTY